MRCAGMRQASSADQSSSLRVVGRRMNRLAAGLLVSFVCSVPVLGQERDRSLERISVALQQPLPVVRGVDLAAGAQPKRLGIFTLIPPTLPGEVLRVSVPIGE